MGRRLAWFPVLAAIVVLMGLVAASAPGRSLVSAANSRPGGEAQGEPDGPTADEDDDDGAASEAGVADDPDDPNRFGRGDDLLRIASVSPWVTPDGEFQVEFEPTTSVPADAQLTVTIHQSIDPSDSLREEITEILDGGALGRILRAPLTVPLRFLGDPATGSRLRIPIRSQRSDSDRIFLPNPGIHPVELVLTTSDGPELWSRVVFLNRLPVLSDGADPAPPVQVSLLVPLDSGPAVTAEGDPSFTPEDRTSLRAFASLIRRSEGVPLTLVPRANTLDGLGLSDEPWADELRTLIAEPGADRGLLAMPYVAVDGGSLANSGADDELRHQIERGRETIERLAGRPTLGDTWVIDTSLTPRALDTLAKSGIDSVLLPADGLQLPKRVAEEDIAARPLPLEGGSGVRALAFDPDVSALLVGTSVEPGTRANEIVAMLMATWFDHAAGQRNEHGPAAAVLLDTATDPAVLQALAPSLTGDGPIVARPGVSPVPPIDPDDGDETVALSPHPTTDLTAALEKAAAARWFATAYRSMTGSNDADLWRWDRVIDQSMSTAVDDGARSEMHRTVREAIEARLAAIELPPERSVVVTSRETTIPLRFRNDLPFEVRLSMQVRSPRLQIEGGETREVVLAPGENRIDLPVTVQASGDSLLRIRLHSSVPGIDLGELAIPVRSTAISGVGAALSIISIAFLIAWWILTHRRERRQESKLSGEHPSTAQRTDDVPAGG